MIRISTNHLYTTTNRDMQNAVSELLRAQEVMATQRKINHLSDDPVGVGRILNTDALIQQNEQFVRNIETATSYAELYDGALGSVVDLLKRTKELVIAETNSATTTEATHEAARIEIVSLASQLVSIGNMQYADRFLFAGYSDQTAPFRDIHVQATPDPGNTGGAAVTLPQVIDPSLATNDTYEVRFTAPDAYDVVNTTTGMPIALGETYTPGETISFEGLAFTLSEDGGAPAAGDVFTFEAIPAGEYTGDSGVVRLEIEQDVFEEVNLTGDKVFHGEGLPNGLNLFDLFQRANVALRNDDQVELNQLLEDFDRALDQTTGLQSLIGSKENLLGKTRDRLLDVKLNLDILVSELRDADITETVTELNRRENAYQAVLNATSKVLQPTLLDFLR